MPKRGGIRDEWQAGVFSKGVWKGNSEDKEALPEQGPESAVALDVRSWLRCGIDVYPTALQAPSPQPFLPGFGAPTDSATRPHDAGAMFSGIIDVEWS